MSKEQRQKRFQQKTRHIDRQLEIAKTYLHGAYNDNNKHKLHKKHAMNCGIPNCYMCANPRRTWGEKTIQETKFECSAVEQTNRDSIGKWEWEDLNNPNMEW
jgi:hypothetical protein